MRVFVANDGRTWSVSLHDGTLGGHPDPRPVGWEAVVFDCETLQRLAFRPAGWLSRAGEAEMQIALEEAESIRTRWEAAGG